MYADGHINVFLFAGQFLKILQEFLLTNKIQHRVFDGQLVEGVHIYVCEDYFPFSFSFLEKQLIGIGTDDLYKNQKTSFRNSKNSFSYLPKVGDFVVHSFYGIGRCKDIVRMKLTHFEKDYFVLEYKNGATLYLPTEQANLVSAYVGGDTPKLNSLGSTEWVRLKQKVKEDLKEIAISLAKIYKERQEKKGVVYERDEELENQFAEAFEFQLTTDQAQAFPPP